MRVVINYPPNIDEIREHFKTTKDTVYTYGDTLYSPHQAYIPEHLMVHEETHQDQQGDDPESWWNKYFTDKKFRVEQEAEAYHNQLLNVMEHAKTQAAVEKFLVRVATDLSGPLYGQSIDYAKAVKLITEGVGK